jgi:hypothetical protein
MKFNLDGKDYQYTDWTYFVVQVGKGKKGHYETRFSFKARPAQAVSNYNCINIGNGYKKRLVMKDGHSSKRGQVIAREAS